MTQIWHAIQFVTSRLSELDHRMFEEGVEAYFPLRWERVRVGNRRYWQVTPWLGSYAFVRLAHNAASPQILADQMAIVLGVRGVVAILMDRAGNPYRSPDGEIARLRDNCLRFRRDQDLPPSRRSLGPDIPADTPVCVIHGPFEGCKGSYIMALGRGKATICIPLFGRETAIDIPDADFVIDASAVKDKAA